MLTNLVPDNTLAHQQLCHIYIYIYIYDTYRIFTQYVRLVKQYQACLLKHFRNNLSETVPWFSPIHKEGNGPCFIHDNIWLFPRICVRAVSFTFRVTKRHPVNISVQKMCSRLERYSRSYRFRIEIKHLYSCLSHSRFNSYAPELVPTFYSAIKHGYRCFIS